MNVRVLALATLVAISLAPHAASASNSVTVAMDAETYSAASTLLGTAPVASILVLDDAGLPVANAEVRVVFLRVAPGVGFVGNETVMAMTNAEGIATAPAPQLSSAPGSYMVVAFAAGTSGSDRYTVGA